MDELSLARFSKRVQHDQNISSKRFRLCSKSTPVEAVREDEEVATLDVGEALYPLNNAMLGSDCIIQAMDILKSQFDQIVDLIDTRLFSSIWTSIIESRLVFKAKNIFILHTPNLSH